MTTSATAAHPSIRVSVRGVSKAFGKTQALSNVSVDGHAGSIHAVTGENGAGKSTLMKLLAGVHQADQGSILIDGAEVHLATPAQARAAGVSTVFQELTVLPNLTVAENLCLGREPRRFGLIDHRTSRARAQEVLQRAGIGLDPDQLCETLSIAERQLLEIAKGLMTSARVFIFDEPTAPLNRAEVDTLERLLRKLKADGALVFYISHRLEEIFRFCDTVTVLKDGAWVATRPAKDLTEDQLVKLMVGRDLKALFPPRRTLSTQTIAIDVARLQPTPSLPRIAFRLMQGEIVGIAGLEGHGQREIIRSLAGVIAPTTAEIDVTDTQGRRIRVDPSHGPIRMVRDGIALIPEDRKSEGLYLDLSVQDNVWLGPLRGSSLWQRAPRDTKLVQDITQRMRLRGEIGDIVGSLSGGNQQKVMLGRWLAAGVNILLVEQPTRGVDVGAKSEIYALLRQFTEDGGTVLVVSGDLLELIGLCDRIMVVRNGAIVGDVPAVDASEEGLLGLALRDAVTAPASTEPTSA